MLKGMRLVLGLVCALLAGGCRQGGEAAAAPKTSSPERPLVTALRPNDRGAVGVIVAHETVDLMPRSSGRIKEILVRLGDKVPRGALVATLDAQSARQELAMAEASLAASNAEFEKATIEAGQAHERAARRQPEAAEGQHLFSKEEVSDYDFAEKMAGPKVRTARAAVAEKAARVKQLRSELAELELRAPFDGTVSARYVDPGAVVGPTTPIVRLISPDDLYVRFAIPEEQAGHVSPEQRVRIVIENLTEVTGKLEKVAPEVDAASRMIIAEARLDVPASWKEKIRSGQVARVFTTFPAERP